MPSGHVFNSQYTGAVFKNNINLALTDLLPNRSSRACRLVQLLLFFPETRKHWATQTASYRFGGTGNWVVYLLVTDSPPLSKVYGFRQSIICETSCPIIFSCVMRWSSLFSSSQGLFSASFLLAIETTVFIS